MRICHEGSVNSHCICQCVLVLLLLKDKDGKINFTNKISLGKLNLSCLSASQMSICVCALLSWTLTAFIQIIHHKNQEALCLCWSLISQPTSLFSQGWKQITVISVSQLLLAHFVALHCCSSERRTQREYYGQGELMFLIFNWHFKQTFRRLYSLIQSWHECSAEWSLPVSSSLSNLLLNGFTCRHQGFINSSILQTRFLDESKVELHIFGKHWMFFRGISAVLNSSLWLKVIHQLYKHFITFYFTYLRTLVMVCVLLETRHCTWKFEPEMFRNDSLISKSWIWAILKRNNFPLILQLTVMSNSY